MLATILTILFWIFAGLAALIGIGALMFGAFFIAWLKEIHLEAETPENAFPASKPTIVDYQYRRGNEEEFNRLMRAFAILTSQDQDLCTDVIDTPTGIRIRMRMMLYRVPVKGRAQPRPAIVLCHGILPVRRRPLADALIAEYGPVVCMPHDLEIFDANKAEAGILRDGEPDPAHHVTGIVDIPETGPFTGHDMMEAHSLISDALLAAGLPKERVEQLLAA